jgi:nicotinamidase-related amidase
VGKLLRMTSEPIRDPVTDHLLTPQNAALVVIDYQPSQIQAVRSIDHDLLVDNIVSVARLAETFRLPVVLSTVNVAHGQGPTVPELKAVLSQHKEIDRTTINSWEDVEFRRAVEATGRRKLIMTALWTEVCLAFPTLDALRAGFDVYPVVDAVGGTSPEAHRAGLERTVQAGAKPISWVSLACELQRDWARVASVPDVVDIVLTTRLLKTA